MPDPWLAVPFAKEVLKPDARVACYSPCIEQASRAKTQYYTHRWVAAVRTKNKHAVKHIHSHGTWCVSAGDADV